MNWNYFNLDHLGSVAIITDGTGNVAQRLSYDPWGKQRNANGTDANCGNIATPITRGFTNQEQMPASCLVNLNARLYDPSIGKFMAADSIVPDAFNGQSYNRYAYVTNNPLSFVDPTGHDDNDPAFNFGASLCDEASEAGCGGLGPFSFNGLPEIPSNPYQSIVPGGGNIANPGATSQPQSAQSQSNQASPIANTGLSADGQIPVQVGQVGGQITPTDGATESVEDTALIGYINVSDILGFMNTGKVSLPASLAGQLGARPTPSPTSSGTNKSAVCSIAGSLGQNGRLRLGADFAGGLGPFVDFGLGISLRGDASVQFDAYFGGGGGIGLFGGLGVGVDNAGAALGRHGSLAPNLMAAAGVPVYGPIGISGSVNVPLQANYSNLTAQSPQVAAGIGGGPKYGFAAGAAYTATGTYRTGGLCQ